MHKKDVILIQTMLERLLLATVLGCTTLSGCSAPQKLESISEIPTQEIAENTVALLEHGKKEEAVKYLKRYEDRKGATMSYLQAITIVAKAGPPSATNFLEYISAGNHFEDFFNYVSASPSLIEHAQNEIPKRLFDLPIYQDGKKGLRAFVRNPGKQWWWHIISEDHQKLTLSNCYAILPAMEIIEGNYGNCARALRIGKPHYLPGRRDRIKYALDNWFVNLVRESAYLPTESPRYVELQLRIKDVEKLTEILEIPKDPHQATLYITEPPK